MKRAVISLYLLLVACDTPILHACDEETPDAVVEGVDVWDLTGRVNFEELSTILEITTSFAGTKAKLLDGLKLTFVPTPIPWNTPDGPTTVNGYYDPNWNSIQVAFTSEMPCILDSALIHELLHAIEEYIGPLEDGRPETEEQIQCWLRTFTEICNATP